MITPSKMIMTRHKVQAKDVECAKVERISQRKLSERFITFGQTTLLSSLPQTIRKKKEKI